MAGSCILSIGIIWAESTYRRIVFIVKRGDFMEQEYILEDCKSFEPEHIFECGQCFRWNKQKDGSYTGIFKQNVVNVKKADNKKIKKKF